MTITPTTTPSPESVPAIILAGGSPLKTASTFANLAKEDLAYLTTALANEHRADLTRLITLPSGNRVIVLRSRAKLTHRAMIRAVRGIVRLALEERLPRISLPLGSLTAGSAYALAEVAEVVATQILMASYNYVPYKIAPAEGWFALDAVELVTDKPRAVAAAVAAGTIIGEETNAARSLSNTPGGDMTPDLLAKHALGLAKIPGVKVTVLDVPAMEKLGMGAVLGVGKGSNVPPRFIVAEYRGAGKDVAPTVLCGKGVTFDTGGINIKVAGASYEMHLDMSGGASVLHALTALARLKAKRNVVALVPAVENMPSGQSYRPGDQLKSLSGKTIEVLNTDAEGRVILADALTYAERFKPKEVIDVATLTGAAVVSLGLRMSGLFTPDNAFAARLAAAGDRAGDHVWRLPLWEEHESEVRGTFGDVANMGKHKTYGGAIAAAAFLWQFAKAYRWAHLDIAPRMTSVDDECLGKGSVGASIQLLVSYLK